MAGTVASKKTLPPSFTQAVVATEVSTATPAFAWRDRLSAVGIACLVTIAINAQLPQITLPGTLVALLCLALIGVILWQNLGPKTIIRVAVLTLGSLILIVSPDPWIGVFGMGALLAAASYWGQEAIRKFAQGFLIVLSLISCLLLLEGSGLLWQEIANGAWSLSHVLTRLFGMAETFGPYQMGWGWIAFAACLWLAQLGIGRAWGLSLRLLLLLVAGTIAAIATRQLLLMLFVIAALGAFGQWSAPAERARISFREIAGAILLLGGAAFMATYCLGSAFSPASRTIGIVEGGLKTLQLPSTPQRVEAEDAVFGGLKLLLPLYGWQDRILPASFDASSLKDIGTLCIINPTRNLSAAQQSAVETLVRNGGSLLVLGDHTDIGGIRGPLNRLLAFTSIRFNYDSAIPLDQNWKWINSLRPAPHPAFGRRDNSSIGILIGASLTCGHSARVLVVGDRSFSDNGRPWYGVSHLGNMSYDPGERLGGLPLVAEERVGRGLVQVWGDTSGFQDTSLTETHTFLAALFRNLQNYRPWPVARIYIAIGYLLVALLGILLLSRHPGALFASALIGALLFTIWTDHGIDRSPWPNLHGQAAVLDSSHLPQYPQTTQEGSLYDLNETFVRRRQLLLRADKMEEPLGRQPGWWVIDAPSQPYTPSESARLLDYVKQGGKLLLIAGYPNRLALRNVLQPLGLDIAPDPYGAAHNSRLANLSWRSFLLPTAHQRAPAKVVNGEFGPEQLPGYDAEIAFQESYPILSKQAIPLVTCWGRPIAILQKVGRGTVILISDARFCTVKNLGKSPQVNVNEIRFLLKCLEQ